MKKFGTVARALLTLALSTAVLSACGGRHDDNNNGYYGGGGIGLNGGTCGQPVPMGGFGNYSNYGARPYAMNGGGRGGFNGGGNFGRGVREELATDKSDFIGGGYGGGYPGGFQNGFGGCGQNEFPACGNSFGSYQGGLMCMPNTGLNMGNVYGYGYNQGAFGQGQIGGLQGCGYGQPCGQIAQTCVIGMPNGCMNGQCIPVNGNSIGGGGVGVCAQQ